MAHYVLVTLIVVCVLLMLKIQIQHRRKLSGIGGEFSEKIAVDKSARGRRFKGYEIKANGDCCRAVKPLLNRTLRSSEIKDLPLATCDQSVCQCQRKLVGERRKVERRQRDDRRSEIRFEPGSRDRRIHQGRRQKDNLWGGGYIG